MDQHSKRKKSAPTPVAKWLPAISALGVLGVVIVAGVGGGGTDSAGANTGDATSTTSAISAYNVPDMTIPPMTTAQLIGETSLTAVKTTLQRTLVPGMSGDDVKAAQARLTQMGFVPGVLDGSFGEQTLEAVWAFQKLVLGVPPSEVPVSGRVSAELWQQMQDPVVVQPRRPGNGTHVEVYLPQQVAAVFTDNVPTLIIHISSGSAMTSARTPENSWCEKVRVDTRADGTPLNPPELQDLCGVSYTPGGVFRFTYQLQGNHVGALGGMYNPVYFNYGIAMHGASNVPLTPESHGCIRMNKVISNSFQSYVHLKDYVYVWGQDGRQPEQYSDAESTPIFNYRDPSATTTTIARSTTSAVQTTTTSKQSATSTTHPAVPSTVPTTSAPEPTSVPSTSSVPMSSGPAEPSTTES